MSRLLPIARTGALGTEEAIHRLLSASHAPRLNPSLEVVDFGGDLERETAVCRIEQPWGAHQKNNGSSPA